MPLNFKDLEIESTVESPFEGDVLNRSEQIVLLSEMAKVMAQSGCVMALNGEWGTGKSTFVRMWRNYIKHQYKTDTLYFNAWESDFVEDPLIALIGELKSVYQSNSKIDSVLKEGGRIATKLISGFTKGVINKLSGFDCDGFSDAIDEASNIGCEHINSYESDKETFDSFKKALSEFTEEASVQYPIVFFVDELDRCNPHYAVKVLERIKHLFDVPNIVFVLSINANQLQHAINGFYGSPKINGKEYLKRFIDLEYRLPEPDLRHYADILCKRNDFESILNSTNDSLYRSSNNKAEVLKTMAKDLISCHGMSLRTANKFIAYTRLAVMGYSSGSEFSADLFILLCYLRMFFPELYKGIRDGNQTAQELLNELESKLPQSLFTDTEDSFTSHHMLYNIAELLLRNNYDEHGRIREPNFIGKRTSDEEVLDFPIISSQFKKEKLNNALTYITRGNRILYDTYGLYPMLKRIELMNHISY